MRRLIFLSFLLLALSGVGWAQGRLPVQICEADGNPCIPSATKIVVTNNTLTRSGNTAIIDTGAGGSGSGDVVGPSSATDNAIVRYDSTTGKLVQDSLVLIGDNGSITLPMTSASGVRETLMRLTVSDSGNGALVVGNATNTNSSFIPSIAGYFDTNATSASLDLRGMVSAANDASDSATPGIIEYTFARTDSATDPTNGTLTAIVNRKLWTINNTGTRVISLTAAGNLSLGSAAGYGFSTSSQATGTIDAAIVRRGTNWVGVSNGSTGVGFLGYARPVTAKTSGYTVLNTDTGTFFTNLGASGSVTFTLPALTTGLTYDFERLADQTVTISLPASVIIRVGPTVTSAGGNVTLDAVGSRITVTAVETGHWSGEVTGAATLN